MPKYYLKNVLAFDCAEGSLMDIAIRAMQKEDYVKANAKMVEAINTKAPFPLGTKVVHKDILRDVKE